VYGQGALSPALPPQVVGAAAVAAAERAARMAHPECIYWRIEERIWRAKHSALRRRRRPRSVSECGGAVCDIDDDGSFYSLQRTDTPLFDPTKGTCEPPSPGSVTMQL
jgi:hypothetical protein